MEENNTNEADELRVLLEQLNDMGSDSVSLADISEAISEGLGKDLSDDELDELLMSSAEEDAELLGLANNLKGSGGSLRSNDEDGEDNEEAPDEAEGLLFDVGAEEAPDEAEGLLFDVGEEEAPDEAEGLLFDVGEEEAPAADEGLLFDVDAVETPAEDEGLMPDVLADEVLPADAVAQDEGLKDEQQGHEEEQPLDLEQDMAVTDALSNDGALAAEALISEGEPQSEGGLTDSPDSDTQPIPDVAPVTEEPIEQAGSPEDVKTTDVEAATKPQMPKLSNMTDEEQLADLLTEVREDALSSEEAAAARAEAVKAENYDYLKELGGSAGEDVDFGFEEEIEQEDVSEEELIDLPDFSFNESFTTGGAIGERASIRKGQAVAARKEEPKTAETKKKRFEINKDSRFYKLFGPVFAISEKVGGAAGKAGGRLKKNKKAQMLLAIAVMFIALIVSGTLLVVQYGNMKRVIAENKVVVEKPISQRLNYASSIYTANTKTLNGRSLSLIRLALDEYMTAFYFDAYIRPDRYFAELRDDTGRYYGIYPALSSGYIEEGAEQTIYWFDGLSAEAEELTLTIWDSVTKNSAVFEVDMRQYEMLPAKYVDGPKGVRTQEYGFDASVEGGAFSSAASTIVYRFDAREDTQIVFGGKDGAKGFISLENTDRATGHLIREPVEYNVRDGVTIGRMDFGPVRTLENKGRLTFGNLYKYYELNRTLPAAPLFNYKQGNETKLDFGIYTLVLEGMRKYGNKYVLVYHCLNKVGERVYCELDTLLRIRTYSGLELSLNPVAHAKQEGGDIVFEYQSPNSIFDNLEPENILIDIDDAMISVPDVVTDIQIPQLADNEAGASFADVKAFAEEAYSKRLAVKSGEGNVDLAGWFGAVVLADSALNALYEAKSVTAPCEYSVMAHTIARLSESEFFAVVEESWLGYYGDDREHYYKTHKVIIEQIGNKYVITGDEIDEQKESAREK